jgi:hypothetical protein
VEISRAPLAQHRTPVELRGHSWPATHQPGGEEEVHLHLERDFVEEVAVPLEEQLSSERDAGRKSRCQSEGARSQIEPLGFQSDGIESKRARWISIRPRKNGTPVTDKEVLNRLLAGKSWGDAAVFTVKRGEETRTLTVSFRRQRSG